MSLKILLAIILIVIYTTRAQNAEGNVTVNIEQQAVEEHTELSSVVNTYESETPAEVPATASAPAPFQRTDPVIERSSHYRHVSPKFHGFWKKKFTWRPRWVKTWKEKKIYVAVWKKMWGPVMVNEWVPIPKPPPGWGGHGIDHGHQAYYVKTHPHY